jgi:hypothetical protein
VSQTIVATKTLKQLYEIPSPAVWELHKIAKTLYLQTPSDELAVALNVIEIQYPTLKGDE